MSDTIWISSAPTNPDRALWMKSDPLPGDQPYPNSYLARNERGEVLGPECFPKLLWSQPAARPAKRELEKLPHLFQGINGWILEKVCADVLRSFDLGKGKLYPISILKGDRQTPFPGEYFILNIGNQKQAFLPGQSPSAMGTSDGRWSPPFVVKDNDIVVSRAALDGPDIWVDARLHDAFFLSAKLGNALVEAKLAKPFRLSKARVD
jgi:hypothetical protein